MKTASASLPYAGTHAQHTHTCVIKKGRRKKAKKGWDYRLMTGLCF